MVSHSVSQCRVHLAHVLLVAPRDCARDHIDHGRGRTIQSLFDGMRGLSGRAPDGTTLRDHGAYATLCVTALVSLWYDVECRLWLVVFGRHRGILFVSEFGSDQTVCYVLSSLVCHEGLFAQHSFEVVVPFYHGLPLASDDVLGIGKPRRIRERTGHSRALGFLLGVVSVFVVVIISLSFSVEYFGPSGEGYRVCESPREASGIAAALQAFGMFLHGLGVPLRVRRGSQESVAFSEDDRLGGGPGMAGFIV